MGGSNSVMSGGARSLKTIQDELAAEKRKSPPSTEDISRLTEEYENALVHKKTLEDTIKHPGTDSDTKNRLEEELAKLTENYNENINGSDSVEVVPNNNNGNNELNRNNISENGELNTASVAGIPNNNENNELNDETRAKLEKCKEKESKSDEDTATENLEKIQESIKKNVPGFFSTFFGNWLSYDNWQSTPDEKEAAECKDLLNKYKKRSSKETEAATEDDESGEAETEPELVPAPATEAATEDDESGEAKTALEPAPAPAPVPVPPAPAGSVKEIEEEAAAETEAAPAPETEAAPAPAPETEAAPAPETEAASAPAPAPVPVPPADSAKATEKEEPAPATAGGRRHTHKNRQKRKRTRKNSRNTTS
jgi:hypothetical protein